ncbi:MAG TPA: IS4 family transposase [Burkholderiales bacterium]|nr:IS4 family transposase [Burkholderiales bacterium]
MHALSMLHRRLALSCPQVHRKRLNSLLAAVHAAVSGSRLALSDLGRGLCGAAGVKHNIKRVDRLLGNGALHLEVAEVYEALARDCLGAVKIPLIIVDWSDLSPDRSWQLLRASMALEGRSVRLYEEVHPLSRAGTRGVHKRFLARLGAMLPSGCRPIMITDAGFRSRWFQLVNAMGWCWIGRIRNRDMVSAPGSGHWFGCKALYAKASAVAQALGRYQYVRSNPLLCDLVIIKRPRRGRHKRSVLGKAVRSYHSLKQARSQREPWLLACSPSLSHLSAQAVVALYAQRMQIEEAFRDLKSQRFGLGLSACRSKQRQRLRVLLLIATLALYVLRLIGEAAKARQLQFQFQSNTRRSRPVLSAISLALQIVRRRLGAFPPGEINAVRRHLWQPHPALGI